MLVQAKVKYNDLEANEIIQKDQIIEVSDERAKVLIGKDLVTKFDYKSFITVEEPTVDDSTENNLNVELEKMKKQELIDFATANGIEVDDSLKKEELIEAIIKAVELND